MPLSRIPYKLSGQQLEAALVALSRASEAFRPSPRENRLYRALGICASIATISIVVTMILAGLSLGGVRAIPDEVIGVFALVFCASGATAMILLIANFSLVRETLRQRGLLKRLGLSELSYSAWRVRRKKQRIFERLCGGLITVVGVLLLIFMVFWALGAKKPDPWEILFALACVFVGVTILAWRFVQRNRARLEVVSDADRLREALMLMQADASEQVIVPAAILERVAGIEQAQIARDRTHAVVAGIRETNRDYAVLKKREAVEQEAALPPEHRLAAEDLIDFVAAHLHSPSAGRQTDGGLLSVRTPDGEVAIDYTVDEENRRVQIVSVRAGDGVASALREGSHAD